MYLDDFLVSGTDAKEHLQGLEALLQHCYGTGIFIVYLTYTSCIFVCGKGVAYLVILYVSGIVFCWVYIYGWVLSYS